MSKFYIAVDPWGWCQKDDFFEAIKGRENDSGKPDILNVFEVEGDPKMTYDFSCWTPQIPGAKLVFSRDFEDREKGIFNYSFPDYTLQEK